jgi:uncharacterized protein DUF5703
MSPRMSTIIALLSLGLASLAFGATPDVVWDSPSKDSSGSMPLGNGDVGLNVWVEEGGDLLFYVSKTDAWSENGRLLKIGRVRVALTPNPFAAGEPFKQHLNPEQGAITIEAGEAAAQVKLRVWVDANYPAARVEVESARPCEVRVMHETWRTAQRELSKTELFSAYGLIQYDGPVVVEPDTILGDVGDRVAWHHHNERSIWATTLRVQGMADWMKQAEDPLLHRTFGGLI